jgi:hypothetical protein
MQASGNYLRGNRLMADVAQRFRAFDRQDLDDYQQAIGKLTGASE